MLELPYTAEESIEAHIMWDAVCGQHSLAAVCHVSLETLREAGIRGGWMNPTHISTALTTLRRGFSILRPHPTSPQARTYHLTAAPEERLLCRVQFEGPWLHPGAHPKAAYRQTHYLAATQGHILEPALNPYAWQPVAEWQPQWEDFVKTCHPKCAGWHFTHIWRLTKD